MILTHCIDCYLPFNDTLKTLFQQLLNISHALERLILMTLENLKTSLGQSLQLLAFGWPCRLRVGYGYK